MRSGIQSVPAIAGFGEACKIAVSDGLSDAPRQCLLRDVFEKNIGFCTGDRICTQKIFFYYISEKAT